MNQVTKYFGALALMVVATAFLGRPAAAAIMLESPGSIVVQQTNDHPCLFGGNSCNNPTGFDFTLLANNPPGDTYDTDSPTYTVGQIRSVLQLTDPVNFNAFMVGIDQNTTAADSETLVLFSMTVYNGLMSGGSIQEVQAYDPGGAGTLLVNENNGTGFSDDLLKTFDLSAFAPGDEVVFHLTQTGSVDGAEEYFLVNAANPEPVPEPSSIALLAASLIGLGAVFRRRQRRG